MFINDTIQSFIFVVGLVFIAYTIIQLYIFLKINKRRNQLLKIFFIVVPLLISVFINQKFLSSKGVDAIARASIISLDSNDDSIKQRLRYYEDVLTHVISNPILGVGLGN